MTPNRTAHQQFYAELGEAELYLRLSRLSRHIRARGYPPQNIKRDLEIYANYILTDASLQKLGSAAGISGERTRQVVARIHRGLRDPGFKRFGAQI